MEEKTTPTKQNVLDPERLFKKKSLLFSIEDVEKLAKESSRIKLIRELMAPNESAGKGYEEYLSKFPDLRPPYTQVQERTIQDEDRRKQFYTTCPSRMGLRWHPCVHPDVSSGEEDISLDWRPRRKKSSCNCGNCTSRHCKYKKSSHSMRSVFKDNIMTFSDKCTMTLKLSHASCSTKTPVVTPKASCASLKSLRSQSKLQLDRPCPHYSKPIYRRPCDLYDDRRYYNKAMRDADPREDCPALRNAYARHCNTHNSGTQYERGKKNLYNEGISDKVTERYPVTVTTHCPHKIMYGGRTFCMNKCPNCRCRGPSSHRHMEKRDSRYHQNCKVEEYNGPVYYDQSSEDMLRVVTIPIVPERYRSVFARGPPGSRSPSIILPKKVITSHQNIEGFIDGPYSRTRKRSG